MDIDINRMGACLSDEGTCYRSLTDSERQELEEMVKWKTVIVEFVKHTEKKVRSFEEGIPGIGLKAQEDARKLYVPLLKAIKEKVEELVQEYVSETARAELASNRSESGEKGEKDAGI